MGELTIVTLCQVLANLTQFRCVLVENSNTCRCVGGLTSSSTVVSAAPQIMFGEMILIFFVLALWLSAIGFCLNQYKSLRRLETQVHYCVTRKDPLNIGEIKIVAREQDSIIYQKKRYSTLLDSQIEPEPLRAMRYVQQYLPKSALKTIPSAPSSIVVANEPSLTKNSSLSIHDEFEENQSLMNFQHETATTIAVRKFQGRLAAIQRAGSARVSATALTVPHPSRNASNMYGNSYSAQHLCVPSHGLRSTRYSDGNISLPVPQLTANMTAQVDEQLLDPRLIPASVRRSLLALHRESQENLYMQRHKEKTQSEIDVHGAFYPWKLKMKSKLRRTHHQPTPAHSKTTVATTSILPASLNQNEHEQRVLDYVTRQHEYQTFTSPSRSITPTVRRNLLNYAKYSTQSTSESEATQSEIPTTTHVCLPFSGANENDSTTSNEKTRGT